MRRFPRLPNVYGCGFGRVAGRGTGSAFQRLLVAMLARRMKVPADALTAAWRRR